MALPDEPVVKKFFSNKIESTRDDWYSYLIRIARIFYGLDGSIYDRDELLNSFREMSSRDANADRDVSNFRDEFGAYGTYLGIFHLEKNEGAWKILVSGAAKQFLCTENPNAAAFCRAQLALFQYPNGAGAAVNAFGTVNVQANSLNDTLREIHSGIKINPLRLICRIVVSQVELRHQSCGSISIPYSTLFCMVNDDRINTTYNPSLEIVDTVFTEYSTPETGINMNLEGLTNFKRNFHILEKTGLFIRDSRFGIMVSQVNTQAAYDCIKTISEMDTHFEAYDGLYDTVDETEVKNIIAGPKWGQYYDAANLSLDLLMKLGVELDRAPITNRSFQIGESLETIDPVSQKNRFREWLRQQVKSDGQPYSENTIGSYISQMSRGYESFDAYKGYTSPFEIQDIISLEEYTTYLFNAPGFGEYNERAGNKACSYGFLKYRDFLSSTATPQLPIRFKTGYRCEFPHNRIIFGAPGTGKSYTLNKGKDALLSEGGGYERVTFHPDYSYASFVGTYKPVPCVDTEGRDIITYSYVPGSFMRTYVKALQNSRTDTPKPYLLVIEEINRANVAAVFGDVFQLLDRRDDEVSEYPIQASEDVKKYLADELGGEPSDYSEIRIPDNMFIWATMNSADQGVFPMDTAFKRRWDFTYLGIDDSEAGIVGKKVILGQGDYRRIVEWNTLRRAINNELLGYKVNEDKLMGPYFISKKSLPEGDTIDPATFSHIFKNKVIMYLFDDAAKQKRPSLFAGCDEQAKNQYSKICSEFDTKGVFIFCDAISSQFIDRAPEDEEE